MNNYCVQENAEGYAIVDMDSGEEINFFYTLKSAWGYIDALNNLPPFVPTEQKMSWLDSLIH